MRVGSEHKLLLSPQIVFISLIAMLDALSSICPQIKQSMKWTKTKPRAKTRALTELINEETEKNHQAKL